MRTTIKCYSELCELPTFEERFAYLKLSGRVGQPTFGFERYLNQRFYRSAVWQAVRDRVILRDCGCDLGVEGYKIGGKVFIHHMNPITQKDITGQTPALLNPEYLVCVSKTTHDALHYGDESPRRISPVARTPNDTCPWKGALWKVY